MTQAKSKPDEAVDRDLPSRPEDPDTQRQKRTKRLLRTDMLPEGALVTQAEPEQDSETEAALKCATDDRQREEPV